MKPVILYRSKYGSAKKYAGWLAEALGCPAYDVKSFRPQLLQDVDTVVFGGGIYASGIAGIVFLRKNEPLLSQKRLAVFAVGASPYDEQAFAAVRSKNMKGFLERVPCFYLRGAFDEGVLKPADRFLIGLLKRAVLKKDPAQYEPWQKALAETIGRKGDWTAKENLRPLLDLLAAEG